MEPRFSARQKTWPGSPEMLGSLGSPGISFAQRFLDLSQHSPDEIQDHQGRNTRSNRLELRSGTKVLQNMLPTKLQILDFCSRPLDTDGTSKFLCKIRSLGPWGCRISTDPEPETKNSLTVAPPTQAQGPLGHSGHRPSRRRPFLTKERSSQQESARAAAPRLEQQADWLVAFWLVGAAATEEMQAKPF